jgi:hypothetical protein
LIGALLSFACSASPTATTNDALHVRADAPHRLAGVWVGESAVVETFHLQRSMTVYPGDLPRR